MSGFPIVDLVIGIMFIYFLLSVINNSIVEIFIKVTKARAKILEEWLDKVFSKPVQLPDGTSKKLGQAIMDHLSVSGLSASGKSPSYIDAKNFSTAILEKLTYNPSDPDSIAYNLADIIAKLKNTKALPEELKRTFVSYAVEAQQSYTAISVKTVGEIEMFKAKIENWYDTSTERLAGALKQRYTRKITFWLAVIITVGMNVDTISLTKYLYTNPEARAKLVAQAYETLKDTAVISNIERIKAGSNDSAKANLDQLEKDIKDEVQQIKEARATLNSTLPLGWDSAEYCHFKMSQGNWNYLTPFKFLISKVPSKLPGWLLTIFAIMMGAPFWFELLNKIANLRSTGSKPESSATEKKDS
jgi:hypothetical protein